MRKIVIGMLLGAALTFSFQAGAATLVGSKVTKTMDVVLDGNQLGKAPVIAGTGYLPIRTLSNSLDVTVAVKGNDVILTSPEEMPKFPYTMIEIVGRINSLSESIALDQQMVDNAAANGKADDPVAISIQKGLEEKKTQLEVWKVRKADLEAALAAQATPTP